MSFAYQICSSSWGCDDIYCFNDHKTGAQVNLGSATAFNCIFFIHVSSDTSNVFFTKCKHSCSEHRPKWRASWTRLAPQAVHRLCRKSQRCCRHCSQLFAVFPGFDGAYCLFWPNFEPAKAHMACKEFVRAHP